MLVSQLRNYGKLMHVDKPIGLWLLYCARRTMVSWSHSGIWNYAVRVNY